MIEIEKLQKEIEGLKVENRYLRAEIKKLENNLLDLFKTRDNFIKNVYDVIEFERKNK